MLTELVAGSSPQPVVIGQGVWTVAAILGRTSLLRASAPAFLARRHRASPVRHDVRLAAEQR